MGQSGSGCQKSLPLPGAAGSGWRPPQTLVQAEAAVWVVGTPEREEPLEGGRIVRLRQPLLLARAEEAQVGAARPGPNGGREVARPSRLVRTLLPPRPQGHQAEQEGRFAPVEGGPGGGGAAQRATELVD